MFLHYTGDNFRVEFARLGEVRSLIVCVIALTATAMKSTRKAVIKRLNMKSPVVLSVTPDKPNLIYSVVEKASMEDVVLPIVCMLKKDGTQAKKVLVCCRYHKEVAGFYDLFKKHFGSHFTSPPGFAKYRVVDMYTSVTVHSVKNQIVKSFCNPDDKLRVVVCTVAFGMGLDCPNVRQIIHWSLSTDLEGYIQETGNGGRDGKPCLATIMYQRADQHHTAKVMMDYCRNITTCRRKQLFKDFDHSD